jgi:N4-gp56 family major capsid protein
MEGDKTMNTRKFVLLPVMLTLFDGNTNVTGDTGLSAEMKTFYDMTLIKLTEPQLVHDQFGQKKPIPQGKGKTIAFRKYDSLPKATTPLTEGVTPNGQKLSMSEISATISQYGAFIEFSDMLKLTAIDNNQVEAMELLAGQAGRTLDTITREELAGGSNVIYGGGKAARHLLVGGSSTATDNDYLTVDLIKKAVRFLKVQNAQKINGDFVAIIHPDNTYDLTNDPDWKVPHDYVDTANVYSGEIGKVGGCRFVETTEAKIFHGSDLASNSRTLLCNGAVSAGKSVTFDGGTVAASALVGRYVIIGGTKAKVTANTTTTLTLDTNVTAADNAVIYPGEGGSEGRDVYATLVIGANAYGVTELSGAGLEYIVKQLGSGGTSDPLNQRATVGWKATKVAKRLVEQYMVRIETTSTFEAGEN